MSGAARDRTTSTRRYGRLLKPAAAIALAAALALAAPDVALALVPRSTRTHALIAFMLAVEAGYVWFLLALPFTLAGVLLLLVLSKRGAKVRAFAARGAAASFALALGVLLSEAVAGARLERVRVPFPVLGTAFLDPPGDSTVDILVIGESSAKGVPYHDWLSVGEIVAWKLREALPARTFAVQSQAREGLKLDQMHILLQSLSRRPDLAILYAGHNEFQMRYDWGHGARHYLDLTPPPRPTWTSAARAGSRVCGLIEETVGLLRRSMPPTHTSDRRLVDVPVYTEAEYAQRLHDFRVRLEAMTAYLEGLGAVVVLVIPPGNDADFEPNRSFLPAAASPSERARVAREFTAAQAREANDPTGALAAYESITREFPRFAEAHYRMARLLEQAGDPRAAAAHYTSARDCDGLPMRCMSQFQDAYREVALRHPHAILIDGPTLFRSIGPRYQAGDAFFSDGFHPSLIGYATLAQAILQKLHQAHAFGWSETHTLEPATPEACATHFEINSTRWAQVCDYSAWFYHQTALVRFDPAARLAKKELYHAASLRLRSGTPVSEIGIPGVGTAIPPRQPKPKAAGSNACGQSPSDSESRLVRSQPQKPRDARHENIAGRDVDWNRRLLPRG